MRLLHYFHTLRYLRPVQVYGRLWFCLNRPRPDLRPAPELRTPTGLWQPGCRRLPSMLDAETFRFLNVTGSLRTAEDWDDPTRLRLWRYNLHYFDDLNAEGAIENAERHRALIARWVRENSPGVGTGWESYPTSLRIVNWVKWALSTQARGGRALDAPALDSLAAQTRWLSKRLEIHLLGNHLFANAKALLFAGVFFAGDEATSWFRKGLTILERELVEQILPDGGHFECSPMYHAIVLEDLLDLINLSPVASGCFTLALVTRLQLTATRMLRWLRVMTHPDGRIALFNDAAFGIAPGNAALADYAQRLAVPVEEGALGAIEALPDSGYVRLQNARAVLICDVASIGPDHLPGHAHADTLSFELSLDDQRVLVNGGTSTYALGADRQRQRGTVAHNTVEIDGQDSSEVWGGFRVARRARPFDVRWGEEDGRLWLEGAHDGYRRLRGQVTHRRRWVLESDELSIEDQLEGQFSSACAALHLHPNISIHPVKQMSSAVVLQLGDGGTARLSCEPSTGISSDKSAWHPEFGRSVDSTVLKSTLQGESLLTRLSW